MNLGKMLERHERVVFITDRGEFVRGKVRKGGSHAVARAIIYRGNHTVYYPMGLKRKEEGIRWARGWDTPEAHVLESICRLSR